MGPTRAATSVVAAEQTAGQPVRPNVSTGAATAVDWPAAVGWALVVHRSLVVGWADRREIHRWSAARAMPP